MSNRRLRDDQQLEKDQAFMHLALIEARLAEEGGEVPVGAVLVTETGQLYKGRNRREENRSPTAHAELIAIEAMSRTLGIWRLSNTTLYVTLEPCPMCAGAIMQARIQRLVFGCRDPKAGAVRSLYQLLEDPRFNHRVSVDEGVCADACAALLTQFFQSLRQTKRSPE